MEWSSYTSSSFVRPNSEEDMIVVNEDYDEKN